MRKSGARKNPPTDASVVKDSQTAQLFGRIGKETERAEMNTMPCGCAYIASESVWRCAKGHEIESKVRANYELTHDDFPPVCFQKDFIGASLDGYNGTSALEIKYVGKDHVDTIPPHHMAQIMAQLWVTGADKVIYLPCDGTRIGTKEVTFDKDLWKSWMPTLKRFCKDVEKARKP